ncbi:hypothetical protein Scep_004083 [Stephania cephalantha]|uniref:Uncharacterized protein n=1 Tax=Stephania cephalantha TaxID=152367 RepID=A0AAP0PWY3_9MAGN
MTMTDQWEAASTAGGEDRREAEKLPKPRWRSRQWEETTNAGMKRAAAPAGGDSRRRQAGGGSALNHYGEASSRQRSNDRRDTDHGGRRTADLTCAGRGDGCAGGRRREENERGSEGGWTGFQGFGYMNANRDPRIVRHRSDNEMGEERMIA